MPYPTMTIYQDAGESVSKIGSGLISGAHGRHKII